MPLSDLLAAIPDKHDPECIYAAFTITLMDDLILTDAGDSFFNITRCGKEHLGKHISEIFNDDYSAHLRGKAHACKSAQHRISYIAAGGSGNCFLWEIGAFISDGCFICSGKKLRRFPTELFSVSDRDRFLGSVTLSLGKNGITADIVSDSLISRFGKDIAEEKFLSSQFAAELVTDRLAADYFDIFCGCVPVHIFAIPSGSKKRPSSAFMIFQAKSSITSSAPADHHGIAAAYSKICSDRIVFTEMNGRFTSMLGKGCIREDELFSAVKGAFLGCDDTPPPCFGFVSDTGITVCVFPSETPQEAFIAAADRFDVIGRRRDVSGELTETEYNAMLLAAGGMTDKAIALSLKISESFVKKALRRGCKKLGVPNRVGITKLFDSAC